MLMTVLTLRDRTLCVEGLKEGALEETLNVIPLYNPYMYFKSLYTKVAPK